MPRLTPISVTIFFTLCAGFGVGYFYEPAVQLTGMAFGFFAFLCLLDFLVIPGKNKIRLSRILPEKLSLGDPNDAALVIRNLTSQPLRGIIAENPPVGLDFDTLRFGFRLMGKEERKFPFVVIPANRGRFEFKEISIRLDGILRLVNRTWHVPVVNVTKVYPSFFQLRNVQLHSRKWSMSQLGKKIQRRYGEGREFESLREYSSGDEYKKINWKATARRGKPIVSQFQIERNQNIIIMIDAGRMMRQRSGSITKLDHAINTALMLSYICVNKEDNVGLMVFNSKVQTFIAPRRGRSQLHRINEALFNAEFEFSEPNYAEAFDMLRRKVSARSLVILLTDIIDERASQIIIREFSSLHPQHLPLFVALKDNLVEQMALQVPPDLNKMLEMGVAQVLLEERLKALALLRTKGILTLDCRPEKLTTDAINKYLEVKAKSMI